MDYRTFICSIARLQSLDHWGYGGYLSLCVTPRKRIKIRCVCRNEIPPNDVFQTIHWVTDLREEILFATGTNFKKKFSDILRDDFENPLKPTELEMDVFNMLYGFDWPFGERP